MTQKKKEKEKKEGEERRGESPEQERVMRGGSTFVADVETGGNESIFQNRRSGKPLLLKRFKTAAP